MKALLRNRAVFTTQLILLIGLLQIRPQPTGSVGVQSTLEDRSIHGQSR